MGDPAGLGRVLTELLNNACKYTLNGKAIRLNVQQTAPANDSRIVFTIANQAEISAQDISHIFERFYRVPSADAIRQGGTGLGLALVHKLVEQMGGSISVISEQGWTTFTIQLPIRPDLP